MKAHVSLAAIIDFQTPRNKEKRDWSKISHNFIPKTFFLIIFLVA